MILHHGTTSAFMAEISRTGLACRPPARASAAGDCASPLVAHEGVYFAHSEETAEWYAHKAAAAFGGEPIVVRAEIDIASCHPDEDEVLFSLQGTLTALWEERDGAPWLAHRVAGDVEFRRSLASRAALAVLSAFEPERMDLDGAAKAIDGMILMGASAMCPSTSDLVGDGGWLDQDWMRATVSRPGGIDALRSGINALCRSVIGPKPTEDTCGIEAFKVRVPTDVGHAGACRILSIEPVSRLSAAPPMA